VCAKNRHTALWDFVDLVDEMCAFGAQTLDDMTVMNDFMTHVDRWAIFFERTLDDLDCTLNPRTKASRLG
jgi:hypothetical protein